MKYNIALVTGGYSSESVISYQSAAAVLNHLDRQKFNVYYIDINHFGWVLKINGENKAMVDKNDFSIIVNDEKIKFDLCFIMMHGSPGEDGKLQGYFDMINQPYLSCNAAVSQLTFNKFYTTSILSALGFKTSKSVLLFREKEYNLRKIIPSLSFPVFVKPNNGGSSIGISKVKKSEDLHLAIQQAYKEDREVIIEQAIIGREFTVGLCMYKGIIQVLPITEIQSKNDFFDFNAKYKGQAIETTPAKINSTIKKKLENAGIEIYKQLQCSGLVRIDMIYNEKDDIPYVLEINTVPGQTPMSFIPQQIKAFKVPLKKFYTQIILEAIKAPKNKSISK